MSDDADWHEHAIPTDHAALERHEKAARHWSALGEGERAELERRAARIEGGLVAVLERDMARVARERPICGARGAREEPRLAWRLLLIERAATVPQELADEERALQALRKRTARAFRETLTRQLQHLTAFRS